MFTHEDPIGITDIPEIDQAVREVRALRNGYHQRARINAAMFRLSGVGIVCLSASVPLLAGLDFSHKDLTIGIIGAIVAVATALQGFYHWDRLWGLLRRTDFDLSHLITDWELDTGLIPEDAPDRKERLHKRTAHLVDAAEELRRRESDQYFASLHFPEGK